MTQQGFLAAIHVHSLYAVGLVLQVEGHQDFAILHLFLFRQLVLELLIKLFQHIFLCENGFGKHRNNIFISNAISNLAEGQRIHVISINADVILYNDRPACCLLFLSRRLRHHTDFPVYALLLIRLGVCICGKRSCTAK